MADYTILVQNKSGASRAYLLFCAPPIVSGVAASAVWRNVLLSARPVPNGSGTATFMVHRQYYAVTGTAPKPLEPGLNVSTGDFELVTVANSGDKGSATYMTVDEEGVHFQPAKLTQSISQANSFSIKTDKSFHYPNSDNIFIGIGAPHPGDPSNIIPVAIFLAQPNTQNIITPQNAYYVTWGTYTSGDVIDVTTIAEPVKIDFTGTRSTKAKVVHQSDGSWVVTMN